MCKLRLRFGKKLRSLRREANFTQEQLAFATGISVDFLSLVERGINAPSFDTIEKLAEALKVPISDFFVFKE